MTESLSVEVKGGLLHYERTGPPGGLPVIAAPGLTSHRSVWHRVAACLPEVDFVSVDLRGRGESRELPGPSTIAQHAEDLLALADALGAERVVVAGHSMGGFVAAAFAAAYPERTAGIVLVDGGVKLAPAPAGDPSSASSGEEGGGQSAVVSDLEAVLARLGQTFPSREAYRDWWRAHPATGPYWNAAIEHYIDTDLFGAEPALRPGADPERVREDMLDMFGSAQAPDPVLEIACPAIALRAQRGLLDQPEGLYPAGALQEVAVRQPRLEIREVADVNHYTIVLEDRGAAQVAQAIRDVISAGLGADREVAA
jgi:lipase